VFAVGIAATCAYLALAQHTFHLEDGYQLVAFYLDGNRRHDVHPLYLPIVGTFVDAFRWTGLGTHRLATAAAAVATGLGVFGVGVLGVLAGLKRRRAMCLAGLAAVCPAIVYFATVVEFHGVFFPFAVLSFVIAEWTGLTRPDARPRWFTPVLLGASTALATLVHSTGHLLVPLLAVWIAGRVSIRARLRELIVFAVVHGVLYTIGTKLAFAALGIEKAGGASRSFQHLELWFQTTGLATRFFSSLLWEGLYNFLPVSLICLVAVAERTKWHKIALGAAGVLPYVALDASINAGPGGAFIYEHGAYLLPLAVPGAFLLVRSRLRTTALVGLIVAGAAISVIDVEHHDVRPGREIAAGVREVAGGNKAVLLCTVDRDHRAMLLEAPEIPALWLPQFVPVAPDAAFRAGLAVLVARVDAALAGGWTVLLSRPPGIESMPELARNYLTRIRDTLAANHRLEEVEARGFRGWRVR